VARSKKLGNNPEAFVKQSIWNMTEDSSAEGVRHWDFKTGLFAEAIVCVIATGAAVMVGTTQHGGAVSLTIFDGEARIRKYVNDSVELDEWSADVIGRAQKYLEAESK